MDANCFQHLPYLEQYNEERQPSGKCRRHHYEPFGICPEQKTGLDDVADGAIPLQFQMIPPMRQRALLLLQDNGLIKLKDGAGLTATVTV